MADENKTDGNNAQPAAEGESLEKSSSAAPASSTSGSNSESNQNGHHQGDKKKFSIKRLSDHFNIYLLVSALLVILVIVGVVFIYFKANQQAKNFNGSNTTSQNLSASALQQLASSGTTIGDAKHILNVESNTVFQGTVLVRGNLQVAGTVQIGNTLALVGLTVSGQTSLGVLQSKDLTVGGKAAIQGQLSAASLSIAGGGSFNGALTAPVVETNSLQLNGDLGITHHIDTGGGVPGSSRGNALGGGGTASVSGSDTAGTISIHTGSNPAAGCFISISFSTSFGNTPHVVVSPVGFAAATLQYYVDRSTSGFSLCTANSATGSTSFDFDYIVMD
jgi:cytoskeletal protein CcmA (bactofilin family)